ncbi:hypothetical protein AB5I41_22785 [Sphingomonas sp. MMS24-JH45]
MAFLMVRRGDDIAYTGTGSFALDRSGHVTLGGTEYRLMTLDESGAPTTVSVDAHRTQPWWRPRRSRSPTICPPARPAMRSATSPSMTRPCKHVWSAAFAKAAKPGAWTLTVTDAAGKTIGTQTLTFTGGVLDAGARALSFTDADAKYDRRLRFLRWRDVLLLGTISTLRAASVYGHASGTMTGLTVNADGRLEIAYSNDQKTVLGVVALADFRDPEALVEQQIGGIFTDRGAAGRSLYGSGYMRVGRVLGRRLEASQRRPDGRVGPHPDPARLPGIVADHQRDQRHHPAAVRHQGQGLSAYATPARDWLPPSIVTAHVPRA